MKKTLEKIIEYAIMVAEPEKIILFGSMLNGKVTPYSDVDLLLIMKDTSGKKNIRELINNFSREIALESDVLIYSKEEIPALVQQPYSFVGAVLKSGKIVYQKAGNTLNVAEKILN